MEEGSECIQHKQLLPAPSAADRCGIRVLCCWPVRTSGGAAAGGVCCCRCLATRSALARVLPWGGPGAVGRVTAGRHTARAATPATGPRAAAADHLSAAGRDARAMVSATGATGATGAVWGNGAQCALHRSTVVHGHETGNHASVVGTYTASRNMARCVIVRFAVCTDVVIRLTSYLRQKLCHAH